MPESEKLHIYEEATTLFWGLIIVVATAAATYLLADSLMSAGWSISGFKQIIVLVLFSISFVGIFKISDPLLHFTLYIKDETLHIEVEKGEKQVKTISIPLRNIEALKFQPHQPRAKHEALYDFSTGYHLMWRAKAETDYQKLIKLDASYSFTLKVEDITKIIRFIRRFNPEIYVPKEQAQFFDL